jgi:Rieske Fe-S protein
MEVEVEKKNDFSTDAVEDSTFACGSCGVTRREALILAASATMLTLLPVYQAVAGTPDQWLAVGKVTDFKVGIPTLVTPAPTEALYVTRIDAKNLVTVSAKCTHHGCQVAWTPADLKFECPCHGAQFASTGKNLAGTRRNPEQGLPDLLSLPTREHKGKVEVNVAGVNVADLEPNS